MKEAKEKDLIRIPVLDKFYVIEGELYYTIVGDKTLRKMKDYNLKDFN